jgi:hypothetical protein
LTLHNPGVQVLESSDFWVDIFALSNIDVQIRSHPLCNTAIQALSNLAKSIDDFSIPLLLLEEVLKLDSAQVERSFGSVGYPIHGVKYPNKN